jgi:hypothetical protein
VLATENGGSGRQHDVERLVGRGVVADGRPGDDPLAVAPSPRVAVEARRVAPTAIGRGLGEHIVASHVAVDDGHPDAATRGVDPARGALPSVSGDVT